KSRSGTRIIELLVPLCFRSSCQSITNFGNGALVTARLVLLLRIGQPVHVDNKIAHVGVVDGLLSLCLPGRIGRRVVRKDADDVELVEVLEFDVSEILELAAKNKMKK